MAIYLRSNLAFPSTLLTATSLQVFELLNDNAAVLNAAFLAAGGNPVTSVTLDAGDGSTITLSGNFIVTPLGGSPPQFRATGPLTGVSRDTPGGNVETITNFSLPIEIVAGETFVASSNLTVQRLLAGDDAINGGALADTLHGLQGNDVFIGGDGADFIIGDDGSDTASYVDKSASVVVFLDALNDVAVTIGGVSEDVLREIENITGGSGNDTLVGGSAANVLRGGAGNDFLFSIGFNPDGTMRPGGGLDTLDGGEGNDALFGGSSGETLTGGGGDDGIVAAGGNDTVNGGAGADFLFGGRFGTDGSRLVNSGNDTLNGDAGNDALYGFDGNDTINGDGDNDYVEAGGGNDIVSGGAGNDTLQGQDDNDSVSGGAGFDYLYGGDGLDTFIFRKGDSGDWVLDFNRLQGDRLRLEGFGFANFAAVPLVDLSTPGNPAVQLTFIENGNVDQLTVFGVTLAQLNATNVMVA